MSTIVVVQKNNVAAIASDTQHNQGSFLQTAKYVQNNTKLLKIDNSYLGIVGSSAHKSVIKSIAKKYPDKICFDSVDDIFETFRSLHDILKDEYYIETKEDDDDQEYESNQICGLVVNPSGIYELQSYREVIKYKKFWAIGSGREYALGAMHAAYNNHKDPCDIAKIGVMAACDFDGATGPPVTVKSVKLNKK